MPKSSKPRIVERRPPDTDATWYCVYIDRKKNAMLQNQVFNLYREKIGGEKRMKLTREYTRCCKDDVEKAIAFLKNPVTWKGKKPQTIRQRQEVNETEYEYTAVQPVIITRTENEALDYIKSTAESAGRGSRQKKLGFKVLDTPVNITVPKTPQNVGLKAQSDDRTEVKRQCSEESRKANKELNAACVRAKKLRSDNIAKLIRARPKEAKSMTNVEPRKTIDDGDDNADDAMRARQQCHQSQGGQKAENDCRESEVLTKFTNPNTSTSKASPTTTTVAPTAPTTTENTAASFSPTSVKTVVSTPENILTCKLTLTPVKKKGCEKIREETSFPENARATTTSALADYGISDDGDSSDDSDDNHGDNNQAVPFENKEECPIDETPKNLRIVGGAKKVVADIYDEKNRYKPMQCGTRKPDLPEKLPQNEKENTNPVVALSEKNKRKTPVMKLKYDENDDEDDSDEEQEMQTPREIRRIVAETTKECSGVMKRTLKKWKTELVVAVKGAVQKQLGIGRETENQNNDESIECNYAYEKLPAPDDDGKIEYDGRIFYREHLIAAIIAKDRKKRLNCIMRALWPTEQLLKMFLQLKESETAEYHIMTSEEISTIVDVINIIDKKHPYTIPDLRNIIHNHRTWISEFLKEVRRISKDARSRERCNKRKKLERQRREKSRRKEMSQKKSTKKKRLCIQSDSSLEPDERNSDGNHDISGGCRKSTDKGTFNPSTVICKSGTKAVDSKSDDDESGTKAVDSQSDNDESGTKADISQCNNDESGTKAVVSQSDNNESGTKAVISQSDKDESGTEAVDQIMDDLTSIFNATQYTETNVNSPGDIPETGLNRHKFCEKYNLDEETSDSIFSLDSIVCGEDGYYRIMNYSLEAELLIATLRMIDAAGVINPTTKSTTDARIYETLETWELSPPSVIRYLIYKYTLDVDDGSVEEDTCEQECCLNDERIMTTVVYGVLSSTKKETSSTKMSMAEIIDQCSKIPLCAYITKDQWKSAIEKYVYVTEDDNDKMVFDRQRRSPLHPIAIIRRNLFAIFARNPKALRGIAISRKS